MTQSLSRQQRRKMERDLKKQQNKKTLSEKFEKKQDTSNFVSKSDLQLLVQDMQKVLNYAKLVDNHVWMLVETLDRKDILDWSDVNETEALYGAKEEKKQKKIKEILEQEDLSIEEYLEIIKDDPSLPGYEKLSINPIKDLNLNPYEVGLYLKETNPDLTQEEYAELGKPWGMTLEHFGFKKDNSKE